MAHVKVSSSHERKKKSTPEADGSPSHKFTGMGPLTKRHFINVQERMVNFLAQQEAWEYGDIDQQPHVSFPSRPPLPPFARSPRPHHHHHHHHHHVGPVFVDGEKALRSEPRVSRPESKNSTPASSRKHSRHNGSSRKQSSNR